MHWLSINPMKTTKAVVSVHLGSELPKHSTEEEEEKIEGPGKSSEGACVEQVKLISVAASPCPHHRVSCCSAGMCG